MAARSGSLQQMGFFPASQIAAAMPKLANGHSFPIAQGGQLKTSIIQTNTTTAQTDANTYVLEKVFDKFGVQQPVFANKTTPQMSPTPGHTVANPAILTYYFHSDHLGSSSYMSSSRGKILQHLEYLPFGEAMMDEHINSRNSPFKYNGKHLDEETNNYFYGARYYDPKLSNFISVDPLAEKTFSSYGYCYNNPINLTDPTGMEPEDFRFTYIDKNGKEQVYIFNGTRGSDAPTEFIQKFQDAYFYNIDNGGGESLKAIAENPFATVDVTENTLDGKFASDVYNFQEGAYGDNFNEIKWNPSLGLETDKGYIESPATVLEHEAGHALGSIFNTSGNRNYGSDSQYDSTEERRVITGTEQRTARANGEIPMFAITRSNHKGLPVITTSPTSNKVDGKATYQFHESRKYKNENFTPSYYKYGQ